MFLARLALATVVDEASRQIGEVCPVFTARLRLFQKATANNPSTISLKEITTQTFEVINAIGTPLLTGEQVIVGQGTDERWFTLPKPHPRFQFVTTGKIYNRQVTVKVLRTINAPPNLTGGSFGQPLQYGDTLTIYDPFNMWSDIEPEATGWAYLAYSQPDYESTEDIDEEHEVRYEIEECSLPVNEIEGTLVSCLMGGMATGTAEVDIDAGKIRSAYPNVDEPPDAEFQTATGGTKEVTFQNTWKLDGVEDSKCVLRRITNLQTSDPENYLAPKARSSTLSEWQIVSVERKIARHIKVTGSGSSWQAVEHYDGFPVNGSGDCEPEITCDLCDPCMGNSDGYAFLDTTADSVKYKVYSTKSAFYGPADSLAIVTDAMNFAGCTLNYQVTSAKVFCAGTPTAAITNLPTYTATLSSGSTISIEDCGSCTWTWQYVGSCAGGGQCHWVMENGTWIIDIASGGNECGEGCDCQDLDIPADNNGEPWVDGDTYETDCLSNLTPDWVKTSDCTAGCTCTEPDPSVPGTTIGETKSADCTGNRSDTNTPTALCVTSALVNVTVLDCAGTGTGTPASAGSSPSCIPITDECPPEETP